MKYIHKIFIPSLLLLLFTAACDTDELHDLNVDPNSVTEIDLNYFLTAAELGSASAGSSGDNRYTDWRTNIGMGAHVVPLVLLVISTLKMMPSNPMHLFNSLHAMLEGLLLKLSDKPAKVDMQKGNIPAHVRQPASCAC
jgi:hypothetical protein